MKNMFSYELFFSLGNFTKSVVLSLFDKLEIVQKMHFYSWPKGKFPSLQYKDTWKLYTKKTGYDYFD